MTADKLKKFVETDATTGVVAILLLVLVFISCPVISANDDIDLTEIRENLAALTDDIEHLKFDMVAFDGLADLQEDQWFEQAKIEMSSAITNLENGEKHFNEVLNSLKKIDENDVKNNLKLADGYITCGFQDVRDANSFLSNSLNDFGANQFSGATVEHLNWSRAQSMREIRKSEARIDGVRWAAWLPFMSSRIEQGEKRLGYSRSALEQARSQNPEYSLGCAYAHLAQREAKMAREGIPDVASVMKSIGIFSVFVVLLVIAGLVLRDALGYAWNDIRWKRGWRRASSAVRKVVFVLSIVIVITFLIWKCIFSKIGV
ncbi:MAG: hypothetical protein AEth_00011 [Candidatus Argoarchaeum ethanivorans]|uniref:Uncharacterized protein n=1 Tax=Candidatus Argoarchaeum ethanivorans TaxID=2608793 RepID=A0A8B3SAW4_9EURY|nr:MAG: hypothetical protein AEth_00011 [Candidatus Argoarchaeum ethanivorans]